MAETTPAGRRMLLIGALCAAAAIVVTLNLRGLEKNLVYYLDANELRQKGDAAHGAVVRLGGLVQQGSLQWDAKTMALHFRVGMHNTGEPSVLVEASGAPPQMFQEGIGAVVEGQYDGATFHADRVMVKHSNEYRPPADGERPKDVMGTLEASMDTAPGAKPRASKPEGQALPAATRYE